MQNIERRVWREARAMTRREVITKAIARQLTWVQASEILGISARHMRRLRRKVERWGMSAVMDQRGGRPRRKRIKAGTIELLCRLKRDVYADFSLRHFYEHVTEKHDVKVSYNWLRLMLQEAGAVEKEPARGKYRRKRERRPMIGMLVHLDASTHEWIAGLPMRATAASRFFSSSADAKGATGMHASGAPCPGRRLLFPGVALRREAECDANGRGQRDDRDQRRAGLRIKRTAYEGIDPDAAGEGCGCPDEEP